MLYKKTKSTKKPFFLSDTTFAYFCVIPAILVLGIFIIYPIIQVFGMSFYKTNMVGDLVRFVGLDNYTKLFASKRFISVIVRTVLWTTLAVSIKIAIGLMIGLALNQKFKLRKIIRGLIILPWATAMPISVMLWRWTLNDEYGLLNYTLKAIGISSDPPIWLAKPLTAFISTLTVDIWLGLPFLGLVFLAGLQSISLDLYEAAKIDGANAFRQFYHITLPGLRKILMIVMLLSFFWTFNDFVSIFILTNGGPAGSTEILVTYLYRFGFDFYKWDAASAMAVITFIILSLTSLIYVFLYKKYEE
jgi:multiple sugar transport system permease protein